MTEFDYLEKTVGARAPALMGPYGAAERAREMYPDDARMQAVVRLNWLEGEVRSLRASAAGDWVQLLYKLVRCVRKFERLEGWYWTRSVGRSVAGRLVLPGSD